jgi:hypothetical protein
MNGPPVHGGTSVSPPKLTIDPQAHGSRSHAPRGNALPDAPRRRTRFEAFPIERTLSVQDELKREFHALRRFRNALLHSAFIEMKESDDVVVLLRSNPELHVDSETGELVADQEMFAGECTSRKFDEIGPAMFRLGQHYLRRRANSSPDAANYLIDPLSADETRTPGWNATSKGERYAHRDRAGLRL